MQKMRCFILVLFLPLFICGMQDGPNNNAQWDYKSFACAIERLVTVKADPVMGPQQVGVLLNCYHRLAGQLKKRARADIEALMGMTVHQLATEYEQAVRCQNQLTLVPSQQTVTLPEPGYLPIPAPVICHNQDPEDLEAMLFEIAAAESRYEIEKEEQEEADFALAQLTQAALEEELNKEIEYKIAVFENAQKANTINEQGRVIDEQQAKIDNFEEEINRLRLSAALARTKQKNLAAPTADNQDRLPKLVGDNEAGPIVPIDSRNLSVKSRARSEEKEQLLLAHKKAFLELCAKRSGEEQALSLHKSSFAGPSNSHVFQDSITHQDAAEYASELAIETEHEFHPGCPAKPWRRATRSRRIETQCREKSYRDRECFDKKEEKEKEPYDQILENKAPLESSRVLDITESDEFLRLNQAIKNTDIHLDEKFIEFYSAAYWDIQNFPLVKIRLASIIRQGSIEEITKLLEVLRTEDFVTFYPELDKRFRYMGLMLAREKLFALIANDEAVSQLSGNLQDFLTYLLKADKINKKREILLEAFHNNQFSSKMPAAFDFHLQRWEAELTYGDLHLCYDDFIARSDPKILAERELCSFALIKSKPTHHFERLQSKKSPLPHVFTKTESNAVIKKRIINKIIEVQKSLTSNADLHVQLANNLTNKEFLVAYADNILNMRDSRATRLRISNIIERSRFEKVAKLTSLLSPEDIVLSHAGLSDRAYQEASTLAEEVMIGLSRDPVRMATLPLMHKEFVERQVAYFRKIRKKVAEHAGLIHGFDIRRKTDAKTLNTILKLEKLASQDKLFAAHLNRKGLLGKLNQDTAAIMYKRLLAFNPAGKTDQEIFAFYTDLKKFKSRSGNINFLCRDNNNQFKKLETLIESKIQKNFSTSSSRLKKSKAELSAQAMRLKLLKEASDCFDYQSICSLGDVSEVSLSLINQGKLKEAEFFLTCLTQLVQDQANNNATHYAHSGLATPGLPHPVSMLEKQKMIIAGLIGAAVHLSRAQGALAGIGAVTTNPVSAGILATAIIPLAGYACYKLGEKYGLNLLNNSKILWQDIVNRACQLYSELKKSGLKKILEDAYPEFENGIAQAQKIAEKCEIAQPDNEFDGPCIPIPKGESPFLPDSKLAGETKTKEKEDGFPKQYGGQKLPTSPFLPDPDKVPDTKWDEEPKLPEYSVPGVITTPGIVDDPQVEQIPDSKTDQSETHPESNRASKNFEDQKIKEKDKSEAYHNLDEIGKEKELNQEQQIKTEQIENPFAIWSKIQATQEVMKGTSIPKSFIIDVDGQKFWVAPNATEHLAEQVAPEFVITEEKKPTERTIENAFKETISFNTPPQKTELAQAELLSELYNVLKEATKEGIPYCEKVRIRGWRIEIRPALIEKGYPSVMHFILDK